MQNKVGLSLKRRLQFQVVLVAVILCILGALSLIHERATMLQDRHDKVRNLVESALTVVKAYEDKAARGELSETVAKQHAASVLNAMRYDEREYFFAFDRDWQWVAHGAKAAMIGKNLSTVKDAAGLPLQPLFANALQ